MNSPKLFLVARKLFMAAMILTFTFIISMPTYATESKKPYKTVTTSYEDADFKYELFLTDQTGASVTNPRTLSAGDKLFVEIRLTRNGYKSPSYDSYGIEFRLMTRGLTYNYDGLTLRSNTEVREKVYADGNSVGFAWYDMQQVGESINNPVLVSSWSYTVKDPSMVNITVPVALIYITEEQREYVPVGPATLFLDPNGGKIVGKDVSGNYTSGTAVKLPEAELGDAVFAGWSDGAKVYPAGSDYVVSGIVTLTAVWEDLERNRNLTLDLKGGELIGEDISGYYADGEIVVLPEVKREGYIFKGWSDGVNTYEAGSEYEVYNTVILVAQWEASETNAPIGESEKPSDPKRPGKVRDDECFICGRDHWLVPIIPLCWICLLIIILIIIVIWAIIRLLLWLLNRRHITYSLVNGDVELNYKNDKRSIHVSVVLDKDRTSYPLGESETSTEENRLRYIENMGKTAIAQVEPGIYDGKLIIKDETGVLTSKCKIKVVDKELKQKK